MIESKKGNISLFLQRTPLVADVAVCISFTAKCSGCTLNKLISGGCGGCTTLTPPDKKCPEPIQCFPEGSEESCLCYALYLVVRSALCGDPLATAKSKVGSVDCGFNNGSFFICWRVKGTGSAVRKSLGIALKSINPAKYYSVYDHCMKSIGRKSDRSNFTYVANALVKNIKDEIVCGVVGNIKTHSAPKKGSGLKRRGGFKGKSTNKSGSRSRSGSRGRKIKGGKKSKSKSQVNDPEPEPEPDMDLDIGLSNEPEPEPEHNSPVLVEGGSENLAESMLQVLAKKLKLSSADGAGSKPNDHINCDHSSLTEIKSSGWHTYVIKDYIGAQVKGLNSMITEKGILLSIEPKRWDTIAAKLKPRVKDYVKLKYNKVGDELANIVAYIVMSNAYVSCSDIKSIIKSKLHIDVVEKTIKDAL